MAIADGAMPEMKEGLCMRVSNYIENKIERYIQEVLRQLPRSDRKAAREKLENTIYAMLESYAGDRTPDTDDLRAVLREFGTPDQAAAAYYEMRDRKLEFSKKKELRIPLRLEAIRDALRILMIIAVAMLVFGLLGLIMNAVSDVRLIFAGCTLALVVQVAQVIMQDGFGRGSYDSDRFV